jgi:hypothetical protein
MNEESKTNAEPATDSVTPAAPDVAWEQVSAGRYMPRRIKGSCKGRALG